jgi:prevent-host-death family protein
MEYGVGMRTVNIGELKNQLSYYLRCVRNGEEIVIRDHSVPVARILPFLDGSGWEKEAQLVASGAMKMPEEEMDWGCSSGSAQETSHMKPPSKPQSTAGGIGESCFWDISAGASLRSRAAECGCAPVAQAASDASAGLSRFQLVR